MCIGIGGVHKAASGVRQPRPQGVVVGYMCECMCFGHGWCALLVWQQRHNKGVRAGRRKEAVDAANHYTANRRDERACVWWRVLFVGSVQWCSNKQGEKNKIM